MHDYTCDGAFGFCLITDGQPHLIEKLKLILSKSSLKSLMLLLVSYIKTLNPITAKKASLNPVFNKSLEHFKIGTKAGFSVCVCVCVCVRLSLRLPAVAVFL